MIKFEEEILEKLNCYFKFLEGEAGESLNKYLHIKKFTKLSKKIIQLFYLVI